MCSGSRIGEEPDGGGTHSDDATDVTTGQGCDGRIDANHFEFLVPPSAAAAIVVVVAVGYPFILRAHGAPGSGPLSGLWALACPRWLRIDPNAAWRPTP
jgi:hypothetical protein